MAGKLGRHQRRKRELAVNRKLAVFFIEKSRLQLKLKLGCMSIHPNICIRCGFFFFVHFFHHPNQTLICLLFSFPFMHIFSYANSIASFLFSLCSTSASYTPLCLDSYLLLFFDSFFSFRVFQRFLNSSRTCNLLLVSGWGEYLFPFALWAS